jgi:uncharacterized protein (DUF302 family)
MDAANPYGPMGITTIVPTPYAETVARVKAALKDEGFGVLTEIDVRATLQAKLGVDFRPYIILGACNPTLSHQALSINPAIGLMLPCNVVVEQREDGCLVSAMDPEAGMAAFGAEDLRPVAAEAKAGLSRAIAALNA